MIVVTGDVSRLTWLLSRSVVTQNLNGGLFRLSAHNSRNDTIESSHLVKAFVTPITRDTSVEKGVQGQRSNYWQRCCNCTWQNVAVRFLTSENVFIAHYHAGKRPQWVMAQKFFNSVSSHRNNKAGCTAESYSAEHSANGQRQEHKLCDNISKMFAAIGRRQALRY